GRQQHHWPIAQAELNESGKHSLSPLRRDFTTAGANAARRHFRAKQDSARGDHRIAVAHRALNLDQVALSVAADYSRLVNTLRRAHEDDFKLAYPLDRGARNRHGRARCRRLDTRGGKLVSSQAPLWIGDIRTSRNGPWTSIHLGRD